MDATIPISCPLCHQKYTKGRQEPVMLPQCGHTFCRRCLLTIPACPTCGKRHLDVAVEDMPINFAQLGIANELGDSKISATSAIEAELTCAICKDQYAKGGKEPVLLPHCGHTFCRMCLVSLQSKSLSCPTCRKPNPSIRVENLPINYTQLEISETLGYFMTPKGAAKCPVHGQPLDLWRSAVRENMCVLCYGEERQRKQSLRRRQAERRQYTIEAIGRRSVVLTQVYLTLKQALTANGEGHCRNYYTNIVESILQSEKMGIVPSAEADRELDALRSLLSPSEDIAVERGFGVSGYEDTTAVRCAAVTDGNRTATLSWKDGCIHVYALRDEAADAHVTVRLTEVYQLLPQENPTVFLDLATGDGPLGRIYISLWAHLRRAQQFLALCLGHLGPCLRRSSFVDVSEAEDGTECLRGGRYLTRDGTSAKALLEELEWSEGCERQGRRGLVVAGGSGDVEEGTLFAIVLDDSGADFACPFGIVVSGIAAADRASRCLPGNPVTVTDVGAVIPDFLG